MKQSAMNRLESEFSKWVKAYNSAKRASLNSESLFKLLCDRIPEDYLRHIGAALINGWLETEQKPSRGYFVRESDRPGVGGGQCTITNYGGGLMAPCWELFVQLSDYGWMRSIAEKKGQRVLLEDRLMDITVCSDDQLILYIENKEKAAAAKKLVAGMHEYGESGFDLGQPDRGDDALRKSKYIVKKDTRPNYIGMSAIGLRQLFKVEYYDGNRFELIEDHRAFSAALAEYSDSQTKPSSVRSPVDPLACEIEQLCPEIWISVGTGETAFNFYAPTDHGDVILIGVYQNGSLWTDTASLAPDLAGLFSSELAKMGVQLDTRKQRSFWRQGKSNFNLAAADPGEIANVVRTVLDKY